MDETDEPAAAALFSLGLLFCGAAAWFYAGAAGRGRGLFPVAGPARSAASVASAASDNAPASGTVIPLIDLTGVLAVFLVLSAVAPWGLARLGGVDRAWIALSGVCGMAGAAVYGLRLWTRRGGALGVLAAGRGWSGRTECGVGGGSVWRDTLLAFFLFLPVTGALAEINQLLTGPAPQESAGLFLLGRGRPGFMAALLAYVVLLGPVAEEIVFRLLLPGVLRAYLGRRGLCLLGGAVFSAIHFDLSHILPLAALGAYWTWLRERTDGLLVPIAMHMLNNLVSAFYLLLRLS